VYTHTCSVVVGSAPVERMKMMGVRLFVSGNTFSKVQGGGSVKLGPRLRDTNCTCVGVVQSQLTSFACVFVRALTGIYNAWMRN